MLPQKRFPYLLLVLLLLSWQVLLPVAHATEDAPGKQTPTKALLWEVKGKGLKQPSYIFGTIHAICPQDFVLAEVVKQKLQQAKQLALEVDLESPDMMATLANGALLPDSVTLRGLYTEEEYARLATYFRSTMHLDLKQLDRVKPFLLSSMMLLQLTDCKTESYETALMQLAKKQQKPIIGLETAQDQLDAFDKIPLKKQATMLLEATQDLEEAKASFRQMVQLYKQQDVDGLLQLMQQDYGVDTFVFEEALLVERNRNWIPVMEEAAKANPTFFAVGAGHLGGEQGVLELLRKSGYTVTAVPF